MAKNTTSRFSELTTPDELIRLLSGEIYQFIGNTDITALWEKTIEIIAITTDPVQLGFFETVFVNENPKWPVMNEYYSMIRKATLMQLIKMADSASKLATYGIKIHFFNDFEVTKAYDDKYKTFFPTGEKEEE